MTVHRGSIFDLGCDAVVSPANSFGFMDGGIDRLYLERFGHETQDRVQALIQEDHFGELPVGAALIAETNDCEFPFLIVAPTMRVPMILGESIHPYLAARATFLLIRHGTFSAGPHCGQPVREHVRTVALPGLGTGVGRVPPADCARQVRAAIEDWVLTRYEFPKTTAQARKRHDRLSKTRAR